MDDFADQQPAAHGAEAGIARQTAATPAIRASDAEREHAVEQLRHATAIGRLTVDELDERLTLVYAARTRDQLARLVADIDVGELAASTGTSTADLRRPRSFSVLPGRGGEHRLIAVMGGHQRRGRWSVDPRLQVISVMGGSQLDFNEAQLSAQTTEITVTSVMGGCEIRVPDGVDVQVSELNIMGGNEIELGHEPVPADAPVLRLRLISVMGGNSIKRGPYPDRDARGDRRQLRRETH